MRHAEKTNLVHVGNNESCSEMLHHFTPTTDGRTKLGMISLFVCFCFRSVLVEYTGSSVDMGTVDNLSEGQNLWTRVYEEER